MRQRLAIRRRILAGCSGLAFTDKLEGELGGSPNEILYAVRILHAGQLHHDAVLALLLDDRLRRSDRIDTILDDLQRLADGRAHLGVEAPVREIEGELLILLIKIK